MKQGRTLSQLAAEIERQQEAKRDIVAPTSKMTVLPRNESDEPNHFWPAQTSIRLDGEAAPTPLTRHATRQLGGWAGVPAKYIDRMNDLAPSLLAHNLNHWLKNQDNGRGSRMIRYLDGNARAFLSDRYRRIDHFDIMQSVLPVILNEAPEVRVGSAQVTEWRMYIKLVFPFLEASVTKGTSIESPVDLVQPAIVITNSEIGAGAFNIQPAIFTHQCTNLMIARKTSLRKNHVGRKIEAEAEEGYGIYADDTLKADDEALKLKMRDTVRHVLKRETFDAHVRALQETAGRSIEGHPEAAVKELGQKVGLLEGELGSVLRHFIDGGDLTQYGLLNAVTRTAQDAEDYDRATELEATGDRVLTLAPNEWRAIATAA